LGSTLRSPLRTRELLGRYLPPPPAAILDIGGPEGAYALPLATRSMTRVQRETVMRAVRRVESERTLLGVSPHLMAIGAKA